MFNERPRGPWDREPAQNAEAQAAQRRFLALVVLPVGALNCIAAVSGMVLVFRGVAEGKVEEAAGGVALIAGSYASSKFLLDAGRARGIEEFTEAANAVDEIFKSEND